MNASFEATLRDGKVGESLIAGWFKSRGYNILPIYEIEINSGKGPRLFTPVTELVAPDMFIFNANNCYWIEAKHKTAFAWNRMRQIWTTGIDKNHFEQYCKVDDITPWPVWLMFLHKGGQAKDSPPNSPKGLFGNSLKYLRKNVNHESDKYGKHGMVYWNKDSLKEICSYEDCIKQSFSLPTKEVSQ